MRHDIDKISSNNMIMSMQKRSTNVEIVFYANVHIDVRVNAVAILANV